MKTNTLFQVRFRPSVKPPRGFTKSAHYNVTGTRNNMAKSRNEYFIGNTWLPAKDFIKIEVEDAPVFEKPPLRKIASLKPDEVVAFEEGEDYILRLFLDQAEREGLVWQYSGRLKPTKYVPNTPHCIGLSDRENNCIAQISLESAKIEKYTILPASKFVEVGTEGIQDLPISKYPIKNQSNPMFEQPQGEIEPPAPELKPFPEYYNIPEGTRLISIEESQMVKKGSTGITLETSAVPYVQWDGDNCYVHSKDHWAIAGTKLAPLDPRDHPEHPEFGKQKQEEPITQAQKDECLKLQERIKELEQICELRQQDIDCLCEDNEAKIEQNTELSKRIDELRDICLVASNTGSKAIMYSVLRAIANGEI